LLGLRNLCDLLLRIAEQPSPADFVIAHARDDEEPTVAELLRRCGQQLGRQPLLLPVPKVMMQMGAYVTGRTAMYERLFQPLLVSDDATRSLFGWQPAHTLDQSLQDLVAGRQGP
jgi:nucleoside-diphosphate-sugar epimerase